MFKKIYYPILILPFLLSQGCSDSTTETQIELSRDQVLEDTKTWFNEISELNTITGSSASIAGVAKNDRDLTKPRANWANAKVFSLASDKFIVSTPVLNRSRTGRSAYQLIVFRDKNKTVAGFIIEVIPDRAYFKKEKQGHDRSFSGQVKLLTATGKRIKTQKFVDGIEVDFYANSISTLRTASGEDGWWNGGDPIVLEEVVIIGESWDYNPFPTYYTWVQDPGWGMSSSNWNDWGGWDSDWRIADFNGNGIMDIGIPMSINAIINDVQDPCLSIQVENALDIGFTNDISDVMESIFGNSTDFNLIIKQGSNFPNDEWAKTNAQGGSSPYGVWLDVAITLNDNKLPSASQEFIMATIYHELLHARLTYEGIPSHASQQQHNEMADCYINVLAGALMSHFPITLAEAKNLAWGGLEGTPAWNNLTTAQKSAALSVNSQHGSGNAGTQCN